MIRIRFPTGASVPTWLSGGLDDVQVTYDPGVVTVEGEKNGTGQFANVDRLLRPVFAEMWSTGPRRFRLVSIETRAGCNFSCSCPGADLRVLTNGARANGSLLPNSAILPAKARSGKLTCHLLQQLPTQHVNLCCFDAYGRVSMGNIATTLDELWQTATFDLYRKRRLRIAERCHTFLEVFLTEFLVEWDALDVNNEPFAIGVTR